jgi:hypothetical protein
MLLCQAPYFGTTLPKAVAFKALKVISAKAFVKVESFIYKWKNLIDDPKKTFFLVDKLKKFTWFLFHFVNDWN